MDIQAMKCTIGSLVASGMLSLASDTTPEEFKRIENLELAPGGTGGLLEKVRCVGLSDEFRKVLSAFPVGEGELPAGFRPEPVLGGDLSVRIDLKRDISYAANGVKRPTNVLYSANTADPREVESMKDFIANLTTNPQIIYEHFLNNPAANVGNMFKDRYEVLEELGRIVGPGVDISCEVNDPFAPESQLMEEIAHFEQILSRYRLVIKVPHTGPLNRDNVPDFLAGTLPNAYDDGATADDFYGHNLAYKLQQKGYRVNFTLMAEPHQTALALLARPYFINAFVENRYLQTRELEKLLRELDQGGGESGAVAIRRRMMEFDMLPPQAADDAAAVQKAREIVKYRGLSSPDGFDGLDSVRHSLRVLRQSNLPDTRLIICNGKEDSLYRSIDKMLMEPEFADMVHRVVLTFTPSYFGRFTCSPAVYFYQRAFLRSVNPSV